MSKRAVHSFGGYATQQLRRLENALARDKMPQSRREEHIRNSMERAVQSFKSRYTEFDKGSFILYTDDSPREDLDREIGTRHHFFDLLDCHSLFLRSV